MFRKPSKDLDIAEKEIERMASTVSFSEFEEAWQNCLSRMERAWDYTERCLKGRKRCQQFMAPFRRLRKKDPLLVFLRQARHAETHAISGTIDKPFQLLVQDKAGRPFQLNDVKVSFENGALSLDLKTPDVLHDFDLKVLPNSPKLVKFENRGVWYFPPKEHIGNPIQDVHPVVVAKCGLQFYRAFIQEAAEYYE